MNQSSKNFGSWEQALEYCVQLHQSGRYSEALEGYRQLLALQPEQPTVLRLLGLVLAQMDRAEDGLAYLQKAARLAPRDPLAQLHLGFVLKRMGHDQQALIYFEKAARLAPQDPAPKVNMAALYIDQRKLNLALEAATQAVALAPGLPEAQHNLGFALLESGRVSEALAPLQCAVDLKQDFPEAWMHLGRAYAERGLHDEAIVAYHQCLCYDPVHTGAAVNLANSWLQRGDADAAIDMYRQVLAREPQRWEAQLSLASALAQDDRQEEAFRLLDGVFPPKHRQADVLYQRIGMLIDAGREGDARQLLVGSPSKDLRYWLISLRLADTDAERDACAQKIYALKEASSTPLTEKIAAEFRLGDLAHEQHDYAEAFACYERGHGLCQESEPYNHADWLARIEAEIQLYDEFRHAGFVCAEPEHTVEPVFIVGLPRSGTTLLEQILDSHPQVAGAGELPDLARMAADQRLRGADAGRLCELGLEYLRKLRRLAPEARYVVDKMPHNFQHLGLIGLLFPKAHIIYAHRDPLDNLLSIWRHRFAGMHAYAHDLSDLGRHYLAHEELVERWRERIPNRLLRVDYESVVDDLEGQVRRLLEFLGLEYNVACLEFYKNPRKVRTASRDQITRPLYRTAVGQWQRYAPHLAPLSDLLQHPG